MVVSLRHGAPKEHCGKVMVVHSVSVLSHEAQGQGMAIRGKWPCIVYDTYT